MAFTRIVDVLEQFGSRNVRATLNDLCESAILKVHDMLHATLALKLKGDV
jgi:hypothetical protein